jgi:phage tail sheath gpL-like
VFTGQAGAVTPGTATFSVDTGDNACASSIAAQINAHAVASTKVRASASSAIVTLRAVKGGTAGNALTLASSGSTLAVSGSTLAGATADTDLAVHASVSGAVVTLHAMNPGVVANETDVRLNYNDGEALPAGVGVAVGAMANGTSNPTLTTLIANMGDTWYNVIANPYTDATSLTALENELASRFGPQRMIDGVMFSAKSDTYANCATLGESRNSPSSSIVRTNASPTPPEEYAAHVAGTVAFYGNVDPARPFQTLPLPYVKAPALADRDTLQEQNLLLMDGIATTSVGPGNLVQIQRLVTTYQTNAAGQPDTSYLDSNTMFTLMYLRFSFRARMSSKYPRHKLASDGARFGAGQAVITPKIGKAEAVGWFEEMEELGLVEDVDQFKNDLVVERNISDPNRLDFLLPPNIINQLVVTAAKIQFLL